MRTATGFIGARILAEALDRRHEVTAVVRDPTRVPAHPNLRAAACDILWRGALADVIDGHDALVSAYNPGHDTDANPRTSTVSVPRSLEHFVEHKRRSTDVPLGGRATYLLFENVRDVAWSYMSPPLFLQPGVRTGRYVEHGDTFPWNGTVPAGISLEDFAVAVLDETERRSHVHRHFTVTAA